LTARQLSKFMGKQSKKNNSPEQKAQWIANKKLTSQVASIIIPENYSPMTKSPSKRDSHRITVAELKNN